MITKYSDLKNKFKRLKRKYLESIQLIIKGIKLAEELNDLELLIILKKKLASIYISIERYKEAIEVLEQIKQLKINLNILDANKNYKVLYEQNKLIYEIGQKIMLNLNEDNIFNVISKEIMRVIRCDSIEILTYNEKREAFQYQGVIKEGKIIDLDNVNLYENKFVIYSIKHKKDLIINDIKKDGYKYIKNYDKYLGEINLKKNKANSLMVVPMIIKDKVKGALSLQCYEKNSYDLKDLTTLKMLSTYIAIALENYFLYKKLKYNSNYDSLTGIFNRGKVIENINLLKKEITIEKFKELYDLIKSIFFNQFVFIYKNQICILYVTRDDNPHKFKIYSKYFLDICDKYNLSLGVSDMFFNLHDIKIAYNQTLKALDYSTSLPDTNRINYYSDFMLTNLVYDFLINENTDNIIDLNFKEFINSASEEYRQMLKLFVDNNGNIKKTADELHVHYNTLKYRLGKIRDEYCIDFEDLNYIIKLKLSYIALDFISNT